MRAALVPGPRGAGGRSYRLLPLDDDGASAGPARDVPGDDALATEVRAVEDRHRPRWVWPATARAYPVLLRHGVRVERCHDVALTEGLLAGHEGRGGKHPFVAELTAPEGSREQDALFDAPGSAPAWAPDGADPLEALCGVHAAQLRRTSRARATTRGFGLLVAAESAAALAACEMGHAGLPWSVEVHDALLAELLGPRPALGGRPARLQALAEQVAAELGVPGLNPDSQPDLLRAVRLVGLPVRTTRRHELRRHDHPALAALLEYKELARLHAAHGWAWQEQWVHDGRFRAEYSPGGVVSGRWATHGGGALQIPRAVRAAVVADPGWRLVLADAGQLEPRVLAALSGDRAMLAATQEGDLYTAVATAALGRPDARAEAKVGLLSAMYGGGAGSPALAALRRRFPAALGLLEDAARRGEDGDVVRSVLGRTCPPPRPGWLDGLPDDAALARARARGRFTRNFVVQASAADWANVLVAGLRRRLAALAAVSAADQPQLVFFQHDEVVVHTPAERADDVVAAVREAGEEATRLVLGAVRIPLDAVVAHSYAQKGRAGTGEGR